jgi:hypothetical protein
MIDGQVAGDVVYERSTWRTVAAAAATGALGPALAFLIMWGIHLLRGSIQPPGLSAALAFTATYTILFTARIAYRESRRPSRIRFTVNGVELAPAGHDGVFVPWSEVSAARVRWVWPVAELKVTIRATEPTRVLLPRDGGNPVRSRRNGRLHVTVPSSGLAATATMIRAEFRRRGVPET